MTIQQFASLFNATGVGIVLVVTLIVLRNAPNRVLTYWALAFGSGLAMIAFLEVGRALGEPLPLSLLAVTTCLAAAWFYLQTALQLKRGKALPLRLYAVVLAIFLAASAWLLVHGTPFPLVAAPPVLLMSAGFVGLGVTLLRHKNPGGSHTGWLGWPLIALGLLTVTYPVVEQTPYAWFGYWLSGLFQLTVGMGMVVFFFGETSAQLRSKNEALQELDHMKTAFIGTVTHELRTPLTMITGAARLLRQGPAGRDDDDRELLEMLDRNVHRLQKLIETILDFSREGDPTADLELSPGDLGATVASAVAALRATFEEKGIALSYQADGEPVASIFDANQISLVLSNLLSNAAKFTPAGGTVQVTLQRKPREVWIVVEDSGIGIDPIHQAKVFERFFQVDRSATREHGGAGLGLSVAKAVVEAHRGHIWLDSSPGEGSVFHIALPIERARQLHA